MMDPLRPSTLPLTMADLHLLVYRNIQSTRFRLVNILPSICVMLHALLYFVLQLLLLISIHKDG